MERPLSGGPAGKAGFSMQKVICKTQDLTLGKASFEDWEALYRNVWSSAETARPMLWTPTASEAEARSRMERTLAWQKTHEAFTIYQSSDGQAIGFVGLMETAPGVWEDTGLALGPAFTGRGYGTQALQALIWYVFGPLKAEKLVCSCRSENEASRRLQLRCGLRYTRSEARLGPRSSQPYTLEFYELTRRADTE